MLRINSIDLLKPKQYSKQGTVLISFGSTSKGLPYSTNHHSGTVAASTSIIPKDCQLGDPTILRVRDKRISQGTTSIHDYFIMLDSCSIKFI